MRQALVFFSRTGENGYRKSLLARPQPLSSDALAALGV